MSGNGCVSPRSQKVDFHSGLILKIMASICGVLVTALAGMAVSLLQDGIENQRQLAVALGELNGGIQVLDARVASNQREIRDLKEDVDWVRDRLVEGRQPSEPQ